MKRLLQKGELSQQREFNLRKKLKNSVRDYYKTTI